MRKNATIMIGIVLLVAAVIYILLRANRANDHAPRLSEEALAQMPPFIQQKYKELIANGGKPEDIFESLFNTSITFYGKVVDQNDDPVVGADVVLYPVDSSANATTTKNALHLKSDVHGLFETHRLHGISLGVEVGKPGYYKPRNWTGGLGWTAEFGYALDLGGGLHQPRKESPVIFHLYKPMQTEPLVYTSSGAVRMPKDGSPVILGLGKTEEGTSLRVQCRSWTDDKVKDSSRHFDWRFEITVLDGGLQERTDDFAFKAPEAGYRESDGCEMTKAIQPGKWREDFRKDYFLKFNGDYYGRAFVEMGAYGGHSVHVFAYINPKRGSHNLEAEPKER